MKHLLKVLCILIITLSSCEKQKEATPNNAEDFKLVEQVVQGVFDDILSSKKSELLSKYMTDDFILLEHGEIWTNDTIVNWCERAKKNDKGVKRINNFDFFKAERTGNRIWMAYHNYATFKSENGDGKAQWLESIVAIKRDTVWKLEMMHSTRVNTN